MLAQPLGAQQRGHIWIFAFVEKPLVFGACNGFGLHIQPQLIGVKHIACHGAVFVSGLLAVRPKYSVGGEKGHLGSLGEQRRACFFAYRQIHCAVSLKGGAYLLIAHLHKRIAEGVADSASDYRPFKFIHILVYFCHFLVLAFLYF